MSYLKLPTIRLGEKSKGVYQGDAMDYGTTVTHYTKDGKSFLTFTFELKETDREGKPLKTKKGDTYRRFASYALAWFGSVFYGPEGVTVFNDRKL